MPFINIFRVSVIVLLLAMTMECYPLCAADGHPLAIVRVADGSVRVENQWGLQVVVSEGAQAKDAKSKPGQQRVGDDMLQTHLLSRRPNQEDATWKLDQSDDSDPNAIRVVPITIGRPDRRGLLVETDGTRIAFVLRRIHARTAKRGSGPRGAVDVVVMPMQSDLNFGDSSIVAWIKSVHPRFVLLPSEISEADAHELGKQCGAKDKIRNVGSNTFAISASKAPYRETELVRLKSDAYDLSPELEQLMAKMEDSCRNSQKVFATLSTNQLNFRPSNGTHTPRWNAEHMMGRQLLFFSQIYHAVDPAIPVMDLNPKQMPPDYSPAHPDWDGKEEARQIQRVSDFTRRFVYLLDGINLDRRAPGSRWTLRGLLRQMERHYDDHTANTRKKFELEDWPAK